MYFVSYIFHIIYDYRTIFHIGDTNIFMSCINISKSTSCWNTFATFY